MMLPQVKVVRVANGASTTSSMGETHCARVAAISPDGAHLALGLNSGEVRIYDANTLQLITKQDLNKFGKRNVINQKGYATEVVLCVLFIILMILCFALSLSSASRSLFILFLATGFRRWPIHRMETL